MTEERLRERVEAEGLRYVRPTWGQGLPARLENIAATRRGERLAVVVPARTDAGWFASLRAYCEIRFVRGRVRFEGHKGRAPFPSAIAVMGPGAEVGAVSWWEAA